MAAALDDLSLTGTPLGDAPLCALADRLGEPLWVELRDAGGGLATARAWAPRLRRARRVVLSGNPIGDAGLEALLAGGAFAAVEDLWLSDCGLTDWAISALCAAELPALRGLWLHGNAVTAAGVSALAAAPLLARLDGLSLFGRSLREPGALVGHPLEGAWRGTCRRPDVGALVFLGR